MSNVVQLFKNKRNPAYERHISTLNMLELIEEMVRFQEERSRVGHLTVDMMVRGITLFKTLADNAESEEMRLLATSYHRHLEHELKEVT